MRENETHSHPVRHVVPHRASRIKTRITPILNRHSSSLFCPLDTEILFVPVACSGPWLRADPGGAAERTKGRP